MLLKKPDPLSSDDRIQAMVAWAYPAGGPAPSVVILFLNKGNRRSLAWWSAVRALAVWVLSFGLFASMFVWVFLFGGPESALLSGLVFLVVPAVMVVLMLRTGAPAPNEAGDGPLSDEGSVPLDR